MAIGEGTKIAIVLSQPLMGDISGNESHFQITYGYHQYNINGPILQRTLTAVSIELDPNDDTILYLNFNKGTENSFQNAVGPITVSFDSNGASLMGAGGPMHSFVETFTPTSLSPKENPIIFEHVSVSVNAVCVLHAIITSSYKSDDEHVSVSASASGTLHAIETTNTYMGEEHVSVSATASGELKDIHDI